jgi:hypothetical protein
MVTIFFVLAKLLVKSSAVCGRAFGILNISKLNLDDIQKVTFHVVLCRIFFEFRKVLINGSAVPAGLLLES